MKRKMYGGPLHGRMVDFHGPYYNVHIHCTSEAIGRYNIRRITQETKTSQRSCLVGVFEGYELSQMEMDEAVRNAIWTPKND